MLTENTAFSKGKRAGKQKVPATANLPVPGMGAIPHDGGSTFRVWAPNAERVEVKLIRQGKRDRKYELSHESDGYWASFVTGAVSGDGYKFVVHGSAGKLERIDPYARSVTNSVGHGIIYDTSAFDWQGDDFSLPPHNELVIYEMHIGSFNAPDGTGSLSDALAQLAHLQHLGINAIQIMPVAEFAGDMSWGYNPANIFAVETAYGGPDGLKTFVRECHKRGIAVILDVVYNHFGPSDLDLWQFDGWSENGGGGIYFYNDHRSSTPWGHTRPDYGRGPVRQFIRDNALMWINEYHMDGLRFDMTLYIRSINGSGGDDIADGWSLMQWINDEVRSSGKPKITIAEDLRSVEAMTGETVHGGAGFNAQWDAQFVHPVRAAVIASNDADRSMQAVRDLIAHRYNGDAFRRVIYSESHDEVANGRARVPHEINPDDSKGWFAQKRSTLAAALMFTAPGIPMLFQGQEFLQGEWFRDDVPLDWHLKDDFRGIVRLYRDLVKLRRNAGGFSKGLIAQNVGVFHINDADKMLAFQRWDKHGAGDDVVVVMNFSAAPRNSYRIGFPGEGEWKLRLNSDSHHYSADFQNTHSDNAVASAIPYDGMPASAEINIAPYSFLIFSQ